MKGSGLLGERKQDTHTKMDKFRPIPVAKLVVHCVTPVRVLGRYPIDPGRLSNQCRTSADRCTPTLPR